MKAPRTMIAIAVAAMIPLGIAAAGDNDQYGGKDKSMSSTPTFKQLDTNKDGKISQAEAAADSSIVFSSADKNGDGYLDKEELKAAHAAAHTNGKQQSMPSQSPESTSPNSDYSRSGSDPNQPAATQPSGNKSPDTETPRQ